MNFSTQISPRGWSFYAGAPRFLRAQRESFPALMRASGRGFIIAGSVKGAAADAVVDATDNLADEIAKLGGAISDIVFDRHAAIGKRGAI